MDDEERINKISFLTSPAPSNEEEESEEGDCSSMTPSDNNKKPVCICRPFFNKLLRDDITNSERTVKVLVEAANELLAYQQNDLMLKEAVFDENTDIDLVWKNGLKHFHTSMVPAIAYVKQLPGYSAVPAVDSCLLFSQAAVPFIISQLAQPSTSDYVFFGMSNYNRKIFFRRFPQFSAFGKQINEISAVMKMWKPTVTELAVLRAMLFYREELRNKFQNPDLIRCLRQRLAVVLLAVLEKMEASDLRLRHFMHVYDLLRCAHEYYVEAASAIFAERTDIQQDHLYVELYVQQRIKIGRKRDNVGQLISALNVLPPRFEPVAGPVAAPAKNVVIMGAHKSYVKKQK